MRFADTVELMKFIYSNMDEHGWFSIDSLRASQEDWKSLEPQIRFLIQHGYIERMDLNLLHVLKRPSV